MKLWFHACGAPVVWLDIVVVMCVYDIIVFIYYVCISNSICHSVRLSHWFNKGYLLACLDPCSRLSWLHESVDAVERGSPCSFLVHKLKADAIRTARRIINPEEWFVWQDMKFTGAVKYNSTIIIRNPVLYIIRM